MTPALTPISQLPLNARHWYLLCVASLEQLIGGALSTIVGIMIPLILLAGTPQLTAFDQGLLGAAGLVGIAAGSAIIGRLMDKSGYLVWFRLCPLIIVAGSGGVFFSAKVAALAFFLFVAGLGVGGGYSLDSAYISELMPARWERFCVGFAKATSAAGFIGGAAFGAAALHLDPSAAIWPALISFIGGLGLVSFVLRLRWHESPGWLAARGERGQAIQAARAFFGPDVTVATPAGAHGASGAPETPHEGAPVAAHGNAPQSAASGTPGAKTPPAGPPAAPAPRAVPWLAMFRGARLQKVILTGVPWACEGLGVYGFGVFLPMLVMALGLQGESGKGVAAVLASVKTTAFINLFIAAGFALGLTIIHRVNLIRLMGGCFLVCAAALGLLLVAHEAHLGAWAGFAGFVVFETALNAGPHLATFILPTNVYAVAERGAGMGIAAMLGKAGAVAGVFLMPALLAWGGIRLVLWVSIAVQLAGAAVTFVYGKKLRLV